MAPRSSRAPNATKKNTKSNRTASAGALYHDLLKDLTENNLFFDELVDMIPSKLYIEGQSGDDYNPKYFKGQAKESKEARRARNKQSKRAKFDPASAETTTQMKQRLEGAATMPQKPALASAPSTASTTSSSTSTPATPSTAIPGGVKQSRIEALRARLHAKLAEKRGNRPVDPNAVSKRAARRAEKKKRQEEAIKRNKKKSTSTAESGDHKRPRLAKGAAATSADASADLATVDFGRLAGLNPVGNGNYTEVNKALKNLSRTKNLEKMLADAESKKKRLEELRASDKPEDKEKAAGIEWGDALREATGERVKDDPARIKKALKRKAAKKLKSSRAWKTRMETTQSKMDERQKIRNHNLGKRKLGGAAGANLSSKRIEATDSANRNDKSNSGGGGSNNNKPGRRASRAGFEGKKQDFLNKKKEQ